MEIGLGAGATSTAGNLSGHVGDVLRSAGGAKDEDISSLQVLYTHNIAMSGLVPLEGLVGAVVVA